jgi:hypothetical protein
MRQHLFMVPLLAALASCSWIDGDEAPPPPTAQPVAYVGDNWQEAMTWQPRAQVGAGVAQGSLVHVLTTLDLPPTASPTAAKRIEPVATLPPTQQEPVSLPVIPKIEVSELPNLKPVNGAMDAAAWLGVYARYCDGQAMSDSDWQIIEEHGGEQQIPAIFDKCVPSKS